MRVIIIIGIGGRGADGSGGCSSPLGQALISLGQIFQEENTGKKLSKRCLTALSACEASFNPFSMVY